MSCRGRPGAMDIKNEIAKSHVAKEEGKGAGVDISVVVNAKDNQVPSCNALLDVMSEVMVGEREREREGGRERVQARGSSRSIVSVIGVVLQPNRIPHSQEENRGAKRKQE